MAHELFVTNRGTNVTGDKRYHGIYVVHQTERVVLSDDSVLRYAMSQRQADTQNTKSNTLFLPGFLESWITHRVPVMMYMFHVVPLVALLLAYFASTVESWGSGSLCFVHSFIC